MRAVVDNTVHVQVQTVEFRNAILCNQLRDSGVSLAHPSEELRNTHDGRVLRSVRSVFLCLVVVLMSRMTLE